MRPYPSNGKSMSFCSAQAVSWTGIFIYMKTMKTQKNNHVAVGKYTSPIESLEGRVVA